MFSSFVFKSNHYDIKLKQETPHASEFNLAVLHVQKFIFEDVSTKIFFFGWQLISFQGWTSAYEIYPKHRPSFKSKLFRILKERLWLLPFFMIMTSVCMRKIFLVKIWKNLFFFNGLLVEPWVLLGSLALVQFFIILCEELCIEAVTIISQVVSRKSGISKKKYLYFSKKIIVR